MTAGAGAAVLIQLLLQLEQQLQQLAALLVGGSSVTSDAACMQAVLGAAQQLLQASNHQAAHSSAASCSSSSSSRHHSFTGWLLSRGIAGVAADPSMLTAAASSSTSSSNRPSELLQLVADTLLGSSCTAALLPQLLQTLSLSAYPPASWQQLLTDITGSMQLPGQFKLSSTQCPVWCSQQGSLRGCGLDTPPVALLALAVQQHWFSSGVFLEHQPEHSSTEGTSTQQQHPQQRAKVVGISEEGAAAAVISWVERAGALLCKPGVAAVQLAVVVAFLRAAVDAAAPYAAAADDDAAAQCPPRARPGWLSGPSAASNSSSLLSRGVLSALARLLSRHSTSGRLHSLLLYLLKAAKGDRAFSWLQQTAQAAAQQPDYPLRQCFIELFGLGTAGDCTALMQQQQLLLLDPFRQMPGYQLALQLLGQAAAFPASAASLLQTNLAEAAAGSAAAVPFTAAVCRQVYLTLLRLLVHAALLLGSAAGLQRPGGLRRLLGAADDEAAQGIVEQVLLQQWQLLLVSCQATEDQLLAVVHTAIQALSDLQLGTNGGSNSSSGSTSGAQHLARHLVSDVDRRAWERQFQEQIAKTVTASPARTLQQLLARSRSSGTDPAAAAAGGGGAAAIAQQYVQCAVEEGLDVAVDDSYRSAHLPALFRRIIQPSLDALAAHYWADPSNAQRYPVTLAVLQELQQQRLQLLPHLSTLTGFEAAFRARWSGTLSRDEAASVPLLTLLKSALTMPPGSSASCSTPVTTAAVAGPRQPAAELSVEGGRQFLTAWNAVAGITTRHECREVQVPTLKPQAAPAAMACVSSQDNGRLLAALLAELAGRQNAFLAVASGRQQQVGSTQQLPLQQEAGLSSKPVQLTQPGDVVDVPAAFQQLQELLACPGSQLAWPGIEYGTGRSLNFDLAAVERFLHSRLVQGKCLLDASTSSLREFAFSGEAFLADFTLLHQVGLKVPQQEMPADEAAELAAALLQQLQLLGIAPASLLPHLEVLLSFVRKTGASPSSTVGEYAAAWLPDGACRQQLMACQVLQQLPLRQLVAVYEAVEDAVAGTARIEDSISSCYSQPLTPQLRQQVFEMTGLLRSSSARRPQGRAAVPAAAVVTVLRRLMLRFLRRSAAVGAEQQGGTKPEVPLSVYCCNAACCRWQWQQFASSSEAAEALLDDLFPAGLLLAHTASVVRLLR